MTAPRALACLLPLALLGACAGVPALVRGTPTQALAGRWSLRIEDDRQRALATATLRFSDARGQSCRGGDWRQVEVTEARATNPGAFPINDALTWRLVDGQLEIGRNGVCDAYVSIAGKLAGDRVQGVFSRFGLGHSQAAGSFTLVRTGDAR